MTKDKEKTNRVFIIGGNQGIEGMFKQRGFEIVGIKDKPHCAVFTGGEDVTPFLYGERPITIDGKDVVQYNVTRDMIERKMFERFLDIPKVGICRGGQFLNIMNGGSMWQHVDNHLGNHQCEFIAGHKVTKDKKREVVWGMMEVTSTHHQMMRPSALGEVLAIAGRSTKKYNENEERTISEPKKTREDVEAVFYWNTLSFCYQPHPEYVHKDHPCQTNFFMFLREYLRVET